MGGLERLAWVVIYGVMSMLVMPSDLYSKLFEYQIWLWLSMISLGYLLMRTTNLLFFLVIKLIKRRSK